MAPIIECGANRPRIAPGLLLAPTQGVDAMAAPAPAAGELVGR